MSNRATLVVANWKMHLKVTQSLALVEKLGKHTKPGSGVQVVLCPAVSAAGVVKLYMEAHEVGFALGVQNVNEHDEGAYTGEVSAAMVRDIATFAIIGHSERRMYYGETSKQVAAKAAACVRNGIRPIVCVGENLHEREAGHGKRRVLDQLRVSLSLIPENEAHHVAIAYEPVWAISTTKHARHANPDDVEPMLRAIRHELEDLYGEQVGAQAQILYGGSVDSHNAGAYFRLDDCKGLLVGSASLNWAEFSAIVDAADGSASRQMAAHAV